MTDHESRASSGGVPAARESDTEVGDEPAMVTGLSGHVLAADVVREIREHAAANVASFPPLTGEQLADIRRIFAITPDQRREMRQPHLGEQP